MTSSSTAAVHAVSDQSFQAEVLEHKGVVLVDFWAPWCGPCKQLLPIIEEYASQVSGVKVCKMNVDENQEIPGEMGIRGIPTLILVKDGAKVATQVGALSKEQLKKWVEDHSK